MKAKRNQGYIIPRKSWQVKSWNGWMVSSCCSSQEVQGREAWAEDSLPPRSTHRLSTPPSPCQALSVSYTGFLKSPSETSSLMTLSENSPTSTLILWSNYFPLLSLKSFQSIWLRQKGLRCLECLKSTTKMCWFGWNTIHVAQWWIHTWQEENRGQDVLWPLGSHLNFFSYLLKLCIHGSLSWKQVSEGEDELAAQHILEITDGCQSLWSCTW